jgi:hypothetical protein
VLDDLADPEHAAAMLAMVLRGHELARAWESERSSSVARARQGARRRGRAQVDGEWRDSREQLCPPTRLEPAAAERSRARACVRAKAKKR